LITDVVIVGDLAPIFYLDKATDKSRNLSADRQAWITTIPFPIAQKNITT